MSRRTGCAARRIRKDSDGRMEMKAVDLQKIERRSICPSCIGDRFLRDTVSRSVDFGTCFYCGSDGTVLALAKLARHFEEAFDSHYVRTSPEPSDEDYGLMKAGIREWEREGEPVVDVIDGMADVGGHVARECPFSEDSYYVGSEPDDSYHQQGWSNVEFSLKTESRFFSQGLRDIFGEIFEVLVDPRIEGKRLIREAGPRKPIAILYRARVFESEERLKEALARPDVHIGPPPTGRARAGRMNADGISVFYGSTSARIALCEVRPSVGSFVVVGEFELLRTVRLLDVGALDHVYAPGSLFDPETINRQARIRFLTTLKGRISMPVTPDNEPSEYLITQVLTEYLADRSDLELDGLFYPSVQTKSPGSNVVLFHRAAKTAPMEFPRGTQMEVQRELDWSEHYVVTEMAGKDDRDAKRNFGATCDDFDYRDSVLQVNPNTLTVHRIKGTSYRTAQVDVKRKMSVDEGNERDFGSERY